MRFGFSAAEEEFFKQYPPSLIQLGRYTVEARRRNLNVERSVIICVDGDCSHQRFLEYSHRDVYIIKLFKSLDAPHCPVLKFPNAFMINLQ